MSSYFILKRDLNNHKSNMPVGSGASAAGGRKSALSEWRQSAESEPALSGDAFAGYRNRRVAATSANTGSYLKVPMLKFLEYFYLLRIYIIEYDLSAMSYKDNSVEFADAVGIPADVATAYL